MKYFSFLNSSIVLLILFQFFSFSIVAFSLENIFTESYYSELNSDEMKIVDNISKEQTTKNFKIVNIDSFELEKNYLFCLFDSINFIIQFKIFNNKIIKIYNNDIEIGHIYKTKNYIHGIINYINELYEIRQLSSKKLIIINTDQTKNPSENCEKLFCEDKDLEQIAKLKDNKTKIQTSFEECKIRVLVAYTPAARDYRGLYIDNDIEYAVYLTNLSYQNSNVNQRMELARTVLTNYTESGNWDVDFRRFNNPNDGYMDEIFNLRDTYFADFIVLIIDNSTYCGEASRILANESTALCMVSSRYNCLTSNYSFAHELGHLMGCRHNPETDPTNYPFSYGHGFCCSNNNWRTIMSYNTSCYNRINYWSNPNIIYSGVQMGTVQTHNNVRELNETENIVNLFRLTPVNYIIPNEIVNNYNIADFFAHLTLETSESFIAEENSITTLRAGNEIILSSGFHAKFNSNLHAYIDNCNSNYLQYKTTLASINHSKSKYFLSIVPNPFSSNTTITITLPEADNVNLAVFDMLGRKIYEFANGTYFSAGEHRFTLESQNLESGMFYVNFATKNNYISKPLILVK